MAKKTDDLLSGFVDGLAREPETVVKVGPDRRSDWILGKNESLIVEVRRLFRDERPERPLRGQKPLALQFMNRALGHPLGMSGTRILGSAVQELMRRGGKRAIATMCIGVGQGLAVTVERP